MKKIAPIIITVLIVLFVSLYLIGLFFTLPLADGPIAYFFILLGIFTVLGFIIAIIYTLIERIVEIKKENEDDLSQY